MRTTFRRKGDLRTVGLARHGGVRKVKIRTTAEAKRPADDSEAGKEAIVTCWCGEEANRRVMFMKLRKNDEM